MSGKNLTTEGEVSAQLLSPRCIFVLVFISHFLDHLLRYLKKRAASDSEQIRLRQEIKQLLQEASSLSTPSTFAQAAKLRRQAAGKEKELKKYQDGPIKEKNWFYVLFGRIVFIAKAVLYLGLGWLFWGIRVVEVPSNLLQPFGRIIVSGSANPSTGLVPVGIIPWLIMTSQVCSLLCQRFSALLNL